MAHVEMNSKSQLYYEDFKFEFNSNLDMIVIKVKNIHTGCEFYKIQYQNKLKMKVQFLYNLLINSLANKCFSKIIIHENEDILHIISLYVKYIYFTYKLII